MTDKRLLTIAAMLPEKVDIAADIGTDHGKLGAYLLETGRCNTMWFSDISAPSLDKARQLSLEKGFGDRAACFTGDGAKPLPGVPDAAVIAGMGGNTISDIIDGGIQKLGSSCLVLQPNTHIYETRLCLMNHGYVIADEKLCEEAGRLYVVIRAIPGKAEYSFEELLAGPVLIHDRGEMMRRYAQRRLQLAMISLEGRKNSQNADCAQVEAEVNVWKKLV